MELMVLLEVMAFVAVGFMLYGILTLHAIWLEMRKIRKLLDQETKRVRFLQ